MDTADLFRSIDGVMCLNGKALNIPQPEEDPDGEWVPYIKEPHEAPVMKWVDALMADLAKTNDLDAPPEPSLNFIAALRCEAMANAPKIDTYLDHIRALPWDGVDRLRTFGHVIGLYVPDEVARQVGKALADRYVETIGRMLAMGPVERHLRPFTQEVVPVIQSGQGTGKSSTLQALALGAGPDTGHHAEIKQLDEAHGGRLVIEKANHRAIAELAELDAMLRRDNKGIVKSFLEGATATYNRKYVQDPVTVRWRAYFVGTTNEEDVLMDTENRRFACIRFRRRKDTPGRSIKDTASALYLPEHPDYRDQVLAQAYYLIDTCGENVRDLVSEDFATVQRAMALESVDVLPVTDLIVKFLLDTYDEYAKRTNIQTAGTPCRVEWSAVKDHVTIQASGGRYPVKDTSRALKEFKMYAERSERYGCIFKRQMWFAEKGRNLSGVEIIDPEMLRTRV